MRRLHKFLSNLKLFLMSFSTLTILLVFYCEVRMSKKKKKLEISKCKKFKNLITSLKIVLHLLRFTIFLSFLFFFFTFVVYLLTFVSSTSRCRFLFLPSCRYCRLLTFMPQNLKKKLIVTNKLKLTNQKFDHNFWTQHSMRLHVSFFSFNWSYYGLFSV